MLQKTKYLLLAFLVGAFLLVPMFVPRLDAQVLYGSVVGTVKDQSGAVIPGAAVTVTNTQTGQIKEGMSDGTGKYSIPNLLEGTYDVGVKMTGFRNYMEKGITVSINTVRLTDITLQVGQVTDTVTVEASAAVLQTSKADVAVNLEAKAIENLPLGGYRNYQSLINLVPGATPTLVQNAVTDTPGRSLQTNVNGTDRGANNTRLDGAADILITMPHHAVYVPPVESVETVNISTNNFDAEQGITGGAAITVATKSGTNDFHGSLFGMHDNSYLRAKRWQENRNAQKKPNSIRNIDGASVGGPIVKNKLFFFGDWEGTFERVGYGAVASVFPADYRTGDFSRKLGDQILDGSGKPILIPTTEGGTTALREGMVFDPFSGNLDGTGRKVFSSGGKVNVIPQARFAAPSKKLLDLIPAPSLPGDVSNYYTSGGQRLNRNNLDFKVNWNRNEKNQIWVKYSIMKALVTCGFSLGKAGGPGSCTGGGLGEGKTQVQVATIGTSYTVSPTFLVDATLGWTRFGQQVDPPDLGTNYGLDVLGIPGTNGPDPRESGFPAFYFSGYTNLGNAESWNPLRRNDQSYTVNLNLNKIKGNHDIRFGLDLMHHLMNHWQPELGEGPRGAFDFAPGTTALNPDALDASVGFKGDTPSFENDWNSVASFLIGASDYTGKSSQFIKMDSHENTWALYVRDRWRVTPKLTLTLGLRWELYPTRRRSQGMGIESYDQTTNDVLVGGWPGVPQDNGIGYSKKLFAPRFGFAYQMASNTVIRGGYGITYHSHPWGAQALRGYYPLTIVGTYSGVNGYQPITTDPNYVKAGIPNAPLGPNVGILSICCPDRSKGRQQLPLAAIMGYPEANKELKRGYIQSFNLIVEHKLPGELVTSVGYVGSHSVNGFGFININAGQIPGAGDEGMPLYAKFGRTADTNVWNGRYGSNYNSLQATLNRRFTGGLFLKGAYTYSHAIGEVEYSDWTGAEGGIWSALSQRYRNRASTAFNIPHMLQLAYVYELPFGVGKKFAQNGPARVVLGGWQINGIFSAVQGRQFTMSASGSSLNMPGNIQTPDQIKPEIAILGGLGDTPYFDTSAFARVTEVRPGNVGRNTMRGPARVNMDFSLFRKFKFTEKVGMEFRAESFNFTNTPHFGNPSGNRNSSNFGKILSDAGDPRSFRFGLRIAF
jgi:hypothetical protein